MTEDERDRKLQRARELLDEWRRSSRHLSFRASRRLYHAGNKANRGKSLRRKGGDILRRDLAKLRALKEQIRLLLDEVEADLNGPERDRTAETPIAKMLLEQRR